MSPLERAIAAGDLERAKSILAAKDRATKAARARRKGRKPRAPGRTKAERDAETDAEDRRVYAAVAKRDDGACQVQLAAMGKCDGPLHIDHQWGRGKAPTREDNCRSLCLRHDGMKTESRTETHGYSRLLWLCDFREWALSRRYFEQVGIADRAIALERAQHPDPKAPTVPIRVEVRDG